ncbi:hypothetical protein Hanom_Chr15g01346801 [Helianthus anomalus]
MASNSSFETGSFGSRIGLDLLAVSVNDWLFLFLSSVGLLTIRLQGESHLALT